MWKLVNRETGKAPANDHKLELRIGKNIISNPTEITQLNMYFTSTVEELVKQNINTGSYKNLHQEIKHCSNSIFIPPVTEEVVSLTNSLKGKHTAGYDDIPKSLVKQCIQIIKGPMTNMYNVSLNSGVFPNEWKTAKVKPLYKDRDKYDIQNYRPISVISVFAKLLERLMFNRLIPFMFENKIFTEAQNGFRKGKCIETAIQSFIEIIQESLDKGLHTIGIFVDLTKAYDIWNQSIILWNKRHCELMA
jgi:hypothetical protein